MGIRNLMPEIVMHQLVGAIRPDRFTESLIKRPTQNMEELRNHTTKFMQVEEHIDYHRNHLMEGPDKVKEKDKDRNNLPVSGRNDRFKENRGPRFNSYTL